MASARCLNKKCPVDDTKEISRGDLETVRNWMTQHHLKSGPKSGTGHECHDFAFFADDNFAGGTHTIEFASGRIEGGGYKAIRDLYFKGYPPRACKIEGD